MSVLPLGACLTRFQLPRTELLKHLDGAEKGTPYWQEKVSRLSSSSHFS